MCKLNKVWTRKLKTKKVLCPHCEKLYAEYFWNKSSNSFDSIVLGHKHLKIGESYSVVCKQCKKPFEYKFDKEDFQNLK
jgi:uncharacterized Zn-finger protein